MKPSRRPPALTGGFCGRVAAAAALSLAGMVLFSFPAATARAVEPSRRVNVVLVHGIYDRGKIFNPMIRVLERQGCRCLAPSLTPNDCRYGVHALALELSERIDERFGPSEPIILVGFSMGGLVTRDYVQNLAGPGRVRGVFLIATPDHGTIWASLALGNGVKQLSWNSTFIQALNQDEEVWRHVPLYSYWTPCDLMILPATSSRWSVGETREIFCLMHPWMVWDHRLVADVSAKIAVLTAGR